MSSPFPANVLRVDDPELARDVLGIDDGDVFNWRSDNTKRLQRSLGKAINGGAAHHLVIGDSISQCYTGSITFRSVWPYLLRQHLSSRGVPLGGTGWVPTGMAWDGQNPKDPRIALTSGTWSDIYGDLASSSSGATLTFTSDLPGTAIAVAYPTTGGVFTVSVDGGAPVTVTPAGGSLAVATYSVTGLADTVHTIQVVRTSGTVTIYGFKVSKSTGLQIHNMALVGVSANNWASEALTPRTRGWLTNRLSISPDVVHIALGANDLNYSRTTTQCVADIETIAGQWEDSDIILHAMPAPSPAASVPTPPSDATWQDYIARMRALATSLDCPLVDLYRRYGSYATANANGLMGDPVHPNPSMHGDWALLVANLVAAGRK